MPPTKAWELAAGAPGLHLCYAQMILKLQDKVPPQATGGDYRAATGEEAAVWVAHAGSGSQ